MIIVFAVLMTVVVAAVFISAAGIIGGFNPTDAVVTNTVAAAENIDENEEIIDVLDPEVVVTPVANAVQPLPENLQNLTVQALRQMATERGIVVTSRDRKVDIMRKLEEAQLA